MAGVSGALRAVLSRETGRPPAKEEEDGRGEGELLVAFCQAFHSQRCFTDTPARPAFLALLEELCVCVRSVEELASVPRLMALRLLLRDPSLQESFMQHHNSVKLLVELLSRTTEEHFTSALPHSADLLRELTNIFQKLSDAPSHRAQLTGCGLHQPLVRLLSSLDLLTLHCSLSALINISKSPQPSAAVASLGCVPALLHILSCYDRASQRMTFDLLLLLTQHVCVRAELRELEALPALLRLLHSADAHLLHRTVGTLERLAEESDFRDDIRLLGGIPRLLQLLSQELPDSDSSEEAQEKAVALKTGCCATLTRLTLSDENSQLILQGNGLYLLCCHMIPGPAHVISDHTHKPLDKLRLSLQTHALRALRFLFSMERNRHAFKKLFTPRLFESFIDIGHYVRELRAYSQLVHTITTLPEGERAALAASVEATNLNRAPLFSLAGYSVIELLGSGAFGSVYKVQKKGSDSFLALKEIRSTLPVLGRTGVERSSSISRLLNEVTIMKEQLSHPNVVRYHKCFESGGHLYIVMELIEGAPLSEHISSQADKGQRFSEERVWKIFSQIVLALRYLHKDKHVIHRDLSPSNIMLGCHDKVTLTDFGLAKQREAGVMHSVVGTMLYWCPELVKNVPYTEKADIWAVGCVLHQMATLTPPFKSSNLLTLAKKIAEVDYTPVCSGFYSSLVPEVVQRCLTSDPQLRPDSVELGALLSGHMMRQLDHALLQAAALQRRLARERQRTVKHLAKAVWTEQRYQQLLSSSSSSTAQPSPSNREDSSSATSDSVFAEAQREVPHRMSPALTSRHSSRVRSQSAVLPTRPRRLSSHTLTAPHSPLTHSRSASVSVSSSQVREITDPVSQLVQQLHKLVFVSQLPPPAQRCCHRRTLVEHYKKSLFDQSSDPGDLKTEMSRLHSTSPSPLPLPIPSSTAHAALRELAAQSRTDTGLSDGDQITYLAAQSRTDTGLSDGDQITYLAAQSRTDTGLSDGDQITYEQLHAILESLLVEHNYY